MESDWLVFPQQRCIDLVEGQVPSLNQTGNKRRIRQNPPDAQFRAPSLHESPLDQLRWDRARSQREEFGRIGSSRLLFLLYPPDSRLERHY